MHVNLDFFPCLKNIEQPDCFCILLFETTSIFSKSARCMNVSWPALLRRPHASCAKHYLSVSNALHPWDWITLAKRETTMGD
jgi:hypothetical protein